MSGRVDITIVPKPWGYEKVWARTDRYAGRILHINAGHALSVQYDNEKEETVYLLAGDLKYWVDARSEAGGRRSTSGLEEVRSRIGDAFRITPGTIHYMEAVTDCDVLEVSTPELDDVVRLRDLYGREGTSQP